MRTDRRYSCCSVLQNLLGEWWQQRALWGRATKNKANITLLECINHDTLSCLDTWPAFASWQKPVGAVSALSWRAATLCPLNLHKRWCLQLPCESALEHWGCYWQRVRLCLAGRQRDGMTGGHNVSLQLRREEGESEDLAEAGGPDMSETRRRSLGKDRDCPIRDKCDLDVRVFVS